MRRNYGFHIGHTTLETLSVRKKVHCMHIPKEFKIFAIPTNNHPKPTRCVKNLILSTYYRKI